MLTIAGLVGEEIILKATRESLLPLFSCQRNVPGRSHPKVWRSDQTWLFKDGMGWHFTRELFPT